MSSGMQLRRIMYLGIVLGVLLPVLPLLIRAFSHRWAFPGILPSSGSLRAWRYILDPGSRVLLSLGNSLIIALSVSFLSMLIGIPAGRALGMYRFRGKAFVEMMVLAPALIPPLAATLGLQVVFIRIGLADTMAGVILVHLIPAIPYMTISMSGVFANYNSDYEEQARSLGAGKGRTFFSITLPAVLPGVVTGGMFAFLISWGQYVLTLLVGGGRIITLPVLLFSFAGSGDTALTGAMSIIFLLPSVVILVFTGRFLSGTSAGMRGFEHL
jgi:putative spermidine/putrescine transport system permease protein